MRSVDHQLQTSRWMRLGVRVAALTLVGITASGCMTRHREDVTHSIPTDYRLRHPITVQEKERTVEVFVGARRGGLNPAQRGEVMAFASNWRKEATGGIIVDVPAGTPNARAAQDASREIRAMLTQAGVPPGAIQARAYRPGNPEMLATVRLNYPKMTAQAGPCGEWPRDIGPALNSRYMENEPYFNLGCANQRNLAAMVDNPTDLVQPRAESPIYAARRSTVIDKFRKGESTATTYPNSQATISDVGR